MRYDKMNMNSLNAISANDLCSLNRKLVGFGKARNFK